MREINKIILHCTATPEGRHVDVDTIRRWHKERGFVDIGYHYVVYLDGSVHHGRPEERMGAHCLGYNAKSIGVCYVGGLDADGRPKDTRTPAQRDALRRLVASLREKFPRASLHCHNEFANKECPCFSISQF